MQRKIIRFTALLCMGLFVYFIVRADPKDLLQILGRLSLPALLFLLLLRLLFWGIRTWSWQIVLECCQAGRVPFFTIFCAELAGHAVGHFTPSAKLGGDAIRAVMLDDVPKNKALASVVVDKSIELMATVLMMGIGLFIALLRIRMAPAQRAVFLALTAAAAALIYVFFRRQKKGLFVWIMEVLRRLRIRSKYLEAKRERLLETDAVIADFYSRHRRAFLKVFLLYTAMVLLWAGELYLSFRFVGLRSITMMKSFLATTLGTVANMTPMIPAGLGFYDMANMSLFAILRIPQKAGIAVILVRRLLNVILAIAGLFPMLRIKKLAPKPATAADPAE